LLRRFQPTRRLIHQYPRTAGTRASQCASKIPQWTARPASTDHRTWRRVIRMGVERDCSRDQSSVLLLITGTTPPRRQLVRQSFLRTVRARQRFGGCTSARRKHPPRRSSLWCGRAGSEAARQMSSSRRAVRTNGNPTNCDSPSAAVDLHATTNRITECSPVHHRPQLPEG
jgi:hypothetical protein